MRGLLITFEGTDGAGKTTQVELLETYLKTQGYRVVVTREPGGTVVSEKIRELIIHPNNAMDSITETMLYAAARREHIAKVIKPALINGHIVLCDRFLDSSIAYQGYARGIDIKMIKKINAFATEDLVPNQTIFMDVSPLIAMKRRGAATSLDRIELEKMEFHQKVYEGYVSLAMENKDRIVTVDATQSVEKIQSQIQQYIQPLLEAY